MAKTVMKKKKDTKISPVKVLAFGPHPDDVEFGCGGLLAKVAKQGYKTAIVDLSLAELSSNGTPETRLVEADNARKALGVTYRENLRFPNNFFTNSEDTQKLIVSVIRKYRPEMVLLPYYFDRHPDHENGSKIIREALFNTGLRMFDTGQEKYRPTYVFCYMMWYEFQPSVIVDITDTYDKKIKSILAYETQFNLKVGKHKTIDNSEDTLKYVEARARTYGFHIQKTYAEAYLSFNNVGADDPFKLLPNFY